MGNDHAGVVMFAFLGDQNALGRSLLAHYRGQLPQQQLSRGHCLGQTQSQELGQGRLLYIGDQCRLIEVLDGFFSASEIYSSAEFSEGVASARKLFHGPVWLGQGIGAAEFIVSAGGTIAVSENIED